jgi:hypothetical protein
MFRQYDCVRIRGFRRPVSASPFDARAPIVGDVATIIEIYLSPPGYELECSDADGRTVWQCSFDPAHLELEAHPAGPM